VFAVRVSPGGPTAAPNAPPASDSAPATPNTVTAFVRLFEACFACDRVETSDQPSVAPALGLGGLRGTGATGAAGSVAAMRAAPF